MSRKSGIIMHISSLPEKYGIGTLGKCAYEFADFLKKAGQQYWQILPMGPTSYGDSPYQSFSAFAGNPYFIDFDLLKQEGILEEKDYIHRNYGTHSNYVDYERLFIERLEVLKIAYENAKDVLVQELVQFKQENGAWLEDYALYMAIKYRQGLRSWQEWDISLKTRKLGVLEECKQILKEEINFWVFVQYLFYKQWHALKKYVNSLGISFIGDLPIYIATDSADAWANSNYFQLDQEKAPIVVAGCPPDAFSSTGQLWGNPIYDWDYLENTNYQWWIDRIRASFCLYDVIRIDHFRGFESYWEIPYGDKTAENGRWVKGPGMKLFKAIENELGDINVIAEDLGYLTEDVKSFLKESGYPGMKVLQFAFDSSGKSDYLPHNYIKNSIAYTGTHDNDTVMGWFETTGDKQEVSYAKRYLKLDEEEGYHWGFIRGVWSSTSNIAIAQMQDFLGVGNEARMNLPSTIGNNWKWRVSKEMLTDALAQKIYELTKLYGRTN